MKVCCMVAVNTNQLDFLFVGKQNRQTKLDKTNKNQIKINIKKDLNKKLKTTRDKCSRIT